MIALPYRFLVVTGRIEMGIGLKHKEFDDLYNALGDFICAYLEQQQTDKSEIIDNGIICAIRDTTLSYMKGNMDMLILINRDQH